MTRFSLQIKKIQLSGYGLLPLFNSKHYSSFHLLKKGSKLYEYSTTELIILLLIDICFQLLKKFNKGSLSTLIGVIV